MLMETKLKPIGPYLIGQVYDYIGRPATTARRYVLSARRWYVVHVLSQREAAVEEEIEELQMAAYVPRAPRKLRTRDEMYRSAHRPIFTGYLFAGFDVVNDPWGRIRDIEGVIRVLKIDDRPVPISDMVMLRVRNKEREECDPNNLAYVPMKVAPGASVRIINFGAFTGLFTIVTEVDRKARRVCVELEMAGHKVPLWLDEENVRVI